MSYDQLADQLAIDCDGFSGASIAGVARAAAARALARAVGRVSGDVAHSDSDSSHGPSSSSISTSSINDCLVTQADFYQAIHDIRDQRGTSDRSEVNGKAVGIGGTRKGVVGGLVRGIRKLAKSLLRK